MVKIGSDTANTAREVPDIKLTRYACYLLSGDISVIDTIRDEEISRIKVGKEPNGISVWYKNN